MADDVLILIDQQKAMDHPKWAPRNNHGAEQNIARLLTAWRSAKKPIIHVKHDSTFPDSPFRPGQEGNDFLPLTAPLPGETVVAKKVHSAFIGTDLPARLEAMGRPPLVICGVLPTRCWHKLSPDGCRLPQAMPRSADERRGWPWTSGL